MWYRIELNKDGSVASCAEVEACAVEGRHVRYVEADSKANALKLVDAWWKMKRAHDIRQRRKREALKAAGLCQRCRKNSAKRADGRVVEYCEKCQGICNEHVKNHRARKARGIRLREQSPESDSDRARLYAARTLKRRAHQIELRERMLAVGVTPDGRLRIRAFREVLNKFDDMTPGDFRAWLVSEIDDFHGRVTSAYKQHPAAAE